MSRRYRITAYCYADGNPHAIWQESAYRDAASPKAAAVKAGMPKDAQAGRRERTMGNVAYYSEPRAQDGTRKVWATIECGA